MSDRFAFSSFLFVLFASACAGPSKPGSNSQPGGRTGEAIVIDWRHTDLGKIPQTWIDKAMNEQVTLYAHRSHGGQLVHGALAYSQANSQYCFIESEEFRYIAGEVSGPCLRVVKSDFAYPEQFWAFPNLVDAPPTGLRAELESGPFTAAMWAWSYDDPPYLPVDYQTDAWYQQYLDQMTRYEVAYPNITWVYQTRYADGTQGDSNSITAKLNEKIRAYAMAHGKVLFDHAAIEAYDPTGNFYPTTGDGTWGDQWCQSHPDDCTSLPSSCTHSVPFSCKLKGHAYWWLMARLAGWDGVSSSP